MRKLGVLITTTLAIGLTASTSLAAPLAEDVPSVVPPTPHVAQTMATNLGTPWGLARLPDGSFLVSDRDSAVVKRIYSTGRVKTVGTVPGVVHDGGEGGLLGLAVTRKFNTDRMVYAYFTSNTDNRIVRMSYTASGLGTPKVLVSGIPKGGIHNGGRIAFGPDDMLYAGTGDTGDSSLSQNKNSLGGKTLRVRPDGTIPTDNPFPNNRVWSLGHRNVQGLAWDEGGRLWASELGQDTWDELNYIRKGKNFGWPICEGRCDDTRFANPMYIWRPAVASPSGLAFAYGTMWMCSLRGQRLWAIPVKGGRLNGTPKAFFVDTLGRLRAISRARDGSLWMATNTGGKVLRLTF